MMILDMFFAMAFAVGLRRVQTDDVAPNPAEYAPRLDPRFGEEMREIVATRLAELAPRRQSTLDEAMDCIDATDSELADAISEVERLIEQKRALVAAMRVRLDAEDADIADRTAKVMKMREALRAEPAADEGGTAEAQG